MLWKMADIKSLETLQTFAFLYLIFHFFNSSILVSCANLHRSMTGLFTPRAIPTIHMSNFDANIQAGVFLVYNVLLRDPLQCK